MCEPGGTKEGGQPEAVVSLGGVGWGWGNSILPAPSRRAQLYSCPHREGWPLSGIASVQPWLALKLLAPAVPMVVHGASSWGSEAQAPGDLASSGDPGGPAYTPAGLCLGTRRNLVSRTGALTLVGVCVCVCVWCSWGCCWGGSGNDCGSSLAAKSEREEAGAYEPRGWRTAPAGVELSSPGLGGGPSSFMCVCPAMDPMWSAYFLRPRAESFHPRPRLSSRDDPGVGLSQQ